MAVNITAHSAPTQKQMSSIHVFRICSTRAAAPRSCEKNTTRYDFYGNWMCRQRWGGGGSRPLNLSLLIVLCAIYSYYIVIICHTIDFRSRRELPQVGGYIFLSPDPLSTTLTTDWSGRITRRIVRTSLLRITLWRMRITHHA